MCRGLIEEAASECLRCQKGVDDLRKSLYPIDVGVGGAIVALSRTVISEQKLNSESGVTSRTTSSLSTSARSVSFSNTENTTAVRTANGPKLPEKEQQEIWGEIAAIEIEQMHWERLFTTRSQEKESVKKVLQFLLKFRRDGRAEKDHLQAQIRQIAAEIPSVVLAMHGPIEAARVSKELNKKPYHNHKCLVDTSPLITSFETPASTTRCNFERYGWETLNLEEQQWVTLDQAMNPEQYTWLQERQKIETKSKANQEFKVDVHKKPRKTPAVARCHIGHDEILRILSEPFEDLNYNERHIHKLLKKFHDDPDRITERLEEHHTDLIQTSRKVRQTEEGSRTNDEQEWISLDKIINPQARYKILQQPPSISKANNFHSNTITKQFLYYSINQSINHLSLAFIDTILSYPILSRSGIEQSKAYQAATTINALVVLTMALTMARAMHRMKDR